MSIFNYPALAVIPARGGSTRLKNKNIHPLGGKPLIRWSVEAIVASGCFDKVLVSTDSDEIFDAVADLPVQRHCRPDHLATTKATVLDAMLNLMQEYDNKGYKYLSYFLPTCPFISERDIIKGASLLNCETEETEFVVSMTEFTETIQLACQMSGDYVLPVFDNLEQGITNSKFIKKYYKPSGAFYMGKWDAILEKKNFFKGNVRGIIIPESRSVDINNIYDIKYAESILA